MSKESNKPSPEHLLELGVEVNRVTEALARLSMDNRVRTEVSVDSVVSAICARRLRGRYFPEVMFADPAWDMMLELLLAELNQQCQTVTDLCDAASVPAPTALRWLNSLVQMGLIVRRDDPFDVERSFVELAPETSIALRDYFREIA